MSDDKRQAAVTADVGTGGAQRPQRPQLPWIQLVVGAVVTGLVVFGLLFDLSQFRFARPWVLLAVPAVWALVLWRHSQRRPSAGTLVFSRAGLFGAQRPGLVQRLRRLPLVLRLMALSLVIVALARPQTTRVDDRLAFEGIDIVLVLDLSGSMEEQDLVPNRLEASKQVIRSFVARRRFDRIGLVIFGADAFTYVPPTLDHSTFLRMLGELRVGLIDGQGTAIGNGIGVALARLRKSEAKSRVVILLTDGDNNAGNITPRQAAEYANDLGVNVYTILAGDHAVAADGTTASVNPDLLTEIAEKTGGKPYLATDERALAQRFQDILERLEKSKIEDRAVLYAELFPRFLWPVLMLLMLEFFLRISRFQRAP